MSDTDLVNLLIPHWHATRAWGEALLVQAFGLAQASDILSGSNRGRKPIPGSQWYYRTHGSGVDITREGNVGGIDFDFDKDVPDPWRLQDFARKQLNAKCLPEVYRSLVTDSSRFDAAARLVCKVNDGAG